MKKTLTSVCLTIVALAMGTDAQAQLSSNPDKFLGNITTGWNNNMDYDGFIFADYWNQVTPENATKWSSIEGTRGTYNWAGADKAANYAKSHNFPFKFHTLVWGSQYPNWMDNLSKEEQLKAIEKWMDAVKAHYPDLPIIDVVNEAVAGHAPAPYKDALGGDGVSGYDWIIRSFEMAAERWPDAILVYNDYNTFQWQTEQFITIVKTLRDAGAPIDAYGCQSHDMLNLQGTDLAPTFVSSMDRMHNELMMPMYCTEYDISTTDDALQKKAYETQIPYMWEKDYCAGITIWGWFYGQTWSQAPNSGLIRNGVERPALTWLRSYMQSTAAKNAKSPFPGMKKEASIYIKPASIFVDKGEKTTITVQARLRTKTIKQVELYVKGTLCSTMTEAPYTAEYTPAMAGDYALKAIVTATDGTKYERYGGFTAQNPRATVANVPGTIEAEDFDAGGEGISFHDSDNKNEGSTSYRSNGGGVDIVTGNGGYAIGYTAAGEWLDFTVNVTEAGTYNYEAFASSGIDGSGFTISLLQNGQFVQLAKVNVPKTADNSWDTYKSITGTFAAELPAGRQRLRISISSPYCNIDKLVLTLKSAAGIANVTTDGIGEALQNAPMYNLQGQRVDDSYRGVVIIGGKKVLRR